MGNRAVLLLTLIVLFSRSKSDANQLKCTDLDRNQYKCKNYPADPKTQQSVTCAPDNSILVMCETADYLNCIGKDQFGFFNKTISDGCHYNAHANFSTAVLLSIFLGFFGIDRIYLGYYAIGLIKMFSLGGLFVFWLIDIVLITLQLFGPADGTWYAMPLYGPRIGLLR
uniref:TM2 domain-containing protein n=1 Tax=Caenorhabditis japonica TaxID=281687 RepID=A0A8R1DI92_CAEJA